MKNNIYNLKKANLFANNRKVNLIALSNQTITNMVIDIAIIFF